MTDTVGYESILAVRQEILDYDFIYKIKIT